MKKHDFKIVTEIANTIPKMMQLSPNLFEAVICSTLDMYVVVHELEREDVLAGVTARFVTAEIEEIDEEDDDD